MEYAVFDSWQGLWISLFSKTFGTDKSSPGLPHNKYRVLFSSWTNPLGLEANHLHPSIAELKNA